MHLATTDEALRNRIAERMKRPPETVPCAGCRSIEGHCPVIGEQCATWVCSRDKGVAFCNECPDFPCIKLMPCSDRASTLPHNIKVYSLALRKSKGALEWEKAIKEAYNLYYQGEMVVGRGPRPKSPPASTP
jgi:hypothetical protein